MKLSIMKKLFIFQLIMFTCLAGAHAQQQGLYTMYNRNGLMYNPGFTGIEDFIDVNLTYRNQWVNLPDAPELFALSAHTKISKRKSLKRKPPFSLRISNSDKYDQLSSDSAFNQYTRHAVGGYWVYDKYDPMRDASIFGTYAYHLPLTSKITWSFGVAVGVTNTRLDGSKLVVLENPDETVNAYQAVGNARDYYFDANFGTILYTDRFYIGYGLAQVMAQEVEREDIEDLNVGNELQLNRHHVANIGYRITLSPMVVLYPSAQVRYVDPAPLSYDVALKARFNDVLTIGGSYRHDGTVNGMVALNMYANTLSVGYAYGYPINDLKDNQNGTHELTIGLAVFNFRNSPTRFMW